MPGPPFASPVPGPIVAAGLPWDGIGYKVTDGRDCAGHRASDQGCALDIGNRRCNSPVLAVAPGTVRPRSASDAVQGIVVIDHGSGWASGYAHMAPVLVGGGQAVGEGQPIGEIGDAHDPAVLNFGGCHLHFALTLNEVEQDPWPLLRQNAAPVMPDYDVQVRRYPTPRTWLTKGGVLVGRRLDPAPLVASQTFDAESPAHASAEYTITPTPTGWPAGPYQLASDGGLIGYLLANSDITLPDPVWPVLPAPPADVGPAVRAALRTALLDAAAALDDS